MLAPLTHGGCLELKPGPHVWFQQIRTHALFISTIGKVIASVNYFQLQNSETNDMITDLTEIQLHCLIYLFLPINFRLQLFFYNSS